jgi:hypothetical protein
MGTADLPEPAAEYRQNLYACHSCAQNSSSGMLFHAYRVFAKLHTGSTFYGVMLIMAADAAVVRFTQLSGDNFMA